MIELNQWLFHLMSREVAVIFNELHFPNLVHKCLAQSVNRVNHIASYFILPHYILGNAAKGNTINSRSRSPLKSLKAVSKKASGYRCRCWQRNPVIHNFKL